MKEPGLVWVFYAQLLVKTEILFCFLYAVNLRVLFVSIISVASIVFIVFSNASFSRNENAIVLNPEIEAEFKGGKVEMDRFINERKQNFTFNTDGFIIVSVQIDKYGIVSYPYIVKGISDIIDRNALQIISEMPAWNPAFEFGKPVKSIAKIIIPY